MELYVTTKDMRLLRGLGFDHVRLPIDPEWITADPATGKLQPELTARLDRTVQQLQDAGLAVVLDLHPTDAWTIRAINTTDGISQLMHLWSNLALHFAETDPERVYFEILNEPHEINADQWMGELTRLIAVVRSQAPEHTVLAGPSQWSYTDSLVAMEPMRDSNVIYTFHWYQPVAFTHEGTTWTTPSYANLHDLPYPSSPEVVTPLLEAIPDASDRMVAMRYGMERWGPERIQAEFALVQDWARLRHVPLYCGEFGAYRAATPPASRARWIHDVRFALEQNGIGWSMWEYQGPFGLVTRDGSRIAVDQEIVKALGLASSD